MPVCRKEMDTSLDKNQASRMIISQKSHSKLHELGMAMRLYRVKLIAIPFILMLFSFNLIAGTKPLAVNINWPEFMNKQDLYWNVLPKSWDEGPFLGNGLLGVQIYEEPNENYIRFEVGNSNVHDHRTGEDLFNRPRLLIGHFALTPVGKIIGGEMRLDLWNAEARGTIKTSKGSISFRSIVHAHEMGIITDVTFTGDESGFRWEWKPANADSPRYLFSQTPASYFKKPEGYISNPQPIINIQNGGGVCVQPLLEKGQTATAWKEISAQKERTLYVNISHSYPENNAQSLAVNAVERISKMKENKLVQSHRKWWHKYYPASFLSLPDAKMENFYWIQMYKLASATRADRALIDNTGPWLTVTPWPNAWWNLNVQLTYWALNPSNRTELGASLENALYGNIQNLIMNVPELYRYNSAGIGRSSDFSNVSPVGEPGKLTSTPEVGLLTWACHNLWLLYRFKMDDQLLKEKLFPLLKKSVNYYLHFLKEDNDGKLHLPTTYSPEYGVAEDCNFDLALLRWGCETLLNTCSRLSISDELIPRWKEVLDKLTDYPIDTNGFMIGRNTPYEKSHRHYSHLLSIYPLYLTNIEKEGNKELIERSLNYWQSKKGHHEGYSLTGASSISSAIGNGNDALFYLNGLFSKFLRPNTMYKEAGPVIETPLSGAQSIHDMLIQSWGGKIRIFPAVPDKWNDIVFHNFRTEGAFLTSARRENGKTTFIRIKSLAGEPCIFISDMITPSFKGARKFKLTNLAKGIFSIDLKKNEEIVLFPKGTEPILDINPINKGTHEQNNFGIRKINNSFSCF